MKAADLGKITLRKETARLKIVLRAVADVTPRGARADRTVVMLAYASMGLHFPGAAPTETASLARCIGLLKAYPWMRAKAFDFLGRLAGSSWPYLIGKWDELGAELEAEIGHSTKVDVQAPRTYRKLHEIVAQRCDKPYCSHAKDSHAFEGDEYKGRCTVEGCECGFFLPPH